MANQMTFKRYEIKYMMTKAQRDQLLKDMQPYMDPDPHGRSTIQSLYFDTPNFELIRRSMEKPVYKEKLRLRSYGLAKEDTEVFLELKKKYQSIVYKRRESMTEQEATAYIKEKTAPRDSQIFRELSYALSHYEGLAPAVLLSYDRQAYYAKDDHEFRMTFDENILWRDYDVDLKKGIYGKPVLGEEYVLLEVKVANAIPGWLIECLSRYGIRQTSFSKYATAFQAILAREAGLNFAPVTPENRVPQSMRLYRTSYKTNDENTETSNQEILGGNYYYA